MKILVVCWCRFLQVDWKDIRVSNTTTALWCYKMCLNQEQGLLNVWIPIKNGEESTDANNNEAEQNELSVSYNHLSGEMDYCRWLLSNSSKCSLLTAMWMILLGQLTQHLNADKWDPQLKCLEIQLNMPRK